MFTASAWPMFGLSGYADMAAMLMAFLCRRRLMREPAGVLSSLGLIILITLMAQHVLQ